MSSKTERKMTPVSVGPPGHYVDVVPEGGFAETTDSDTDSMEITVNAKGQVQASFKVYFREGDDRQAMDRIWDMEARLQAHYGERYAGYREPDALAKKLEASIEALRKE